ncbi:MAG: hypothetical protein M3436_10170 [Pseudomonadota bacterium]|nr:hypothetical protein [Pseudomonadota bacterium]
MNYWLKTSICFLILLFGQMKAGLAVEEISQPIRMAVGPVVPDDPLPPSCEADGICRVNECRNNPDPDCPELPDSSGPSDAPETTGNTTETGVSGIKGSVFVTGDADSTTHALYGISSKERSDEPCLVTALKEHINDSSKDTTPHADLCGPKGSTSSEIKAAFGDSHFQGKRVFLTGVQVCMNNDKTRVKGFKIRGKKITDDGELVDLERKERTPGQAGGSDQGLGIGTEQKDDRWNCDQKEGWMDWAECPVNSLATAAVLHFQAGADPRSLTGIALKCQSIEDMGVAS